jgi:hypothetical protein
MNFIAIKTMRTFKFLVIVVTAILIQVSCRKIENLSFTPSIKFNSFTVFDTLDILGNAAKAGKLSFYFEDGDGDVGLDPPTDFQIDSTNMYFSLFRKVDGVMEPAPAIDPLLPYAAYRIPYMERLGQNKILKGTILVTFLYQFYSQSDTIRYDFYIRDRALNDSNTESTSEIIVSENNIYR